MPSLDCDVENLAFLAPDSRADSGVRRIRLARDFIRFERKVAGVGMRLEVPLAAYRGVILTCERKLNQNFYRITLTHRDPDLSVTLHRATPTPALVDIWHDWACFFSKPALYEESEGTKVLNKPSRNARRRRALSLAERRPAVSSRRAPRWQMSRVIRPIRELFSRE